MIGGDMKLSEILKDWPEKLNDRVQFIHEDSVEDTDIVLQPEKAHNTALTSCDREIDREALAIVLFSEHHNGKWIGHSEQEEYLERADFIISTMPTWLKPTERE